MFCINCGTKLPDGAKFCFNCGARVPDLATDDAPEQAPAAEKGDAAPVVQTAVPAASAGAGQTGGEPVSAPKKETLPEVPGSHALILGRYPIDFPRPLALRRQLWAPFNREGARQRRLVGKYIREHLHVEDYTDPAALVEFLTRIIFDACEPAMDAAVEALMDHGIDFVSKKDLLDKLFEQYKETDLVRELAEDQAAISRYLEQLGEEKEMNKAHWQGGGFGITGAITGAVKAGMLNMASDGLSALGRAVTGNTYSGRAQRFIRQRLDSHNYAGMGASLADNIISVWLVNELVHVLEDSHKLPPFHFRTKEVKSRMDNLQVMLENGRYSKEKAMETLCECLTQTGATFSVYLAMAKLAPDAIPDILDVADTEGEGLSLAASLWQDLHQKGDIAFPRWVDCLGVERGYAVRTPEEMAVLRYLMREYPEGYEGLRIVLVDASGVTLPFYPDLEEVSYYGFGGQLQFAYKGTEPIDFAAKKIRFYQIRFAPPYGEVAAAQVETFKQDAQKALDQGEQQQAAASYQAAADMGDREAMYRLGLVCRDLGEPEEASKWLQTAAELGEPDAAWEFYRQSVQDGSPESDYLFAAAKGGQGEASMQLGELYETGTEMEDGKDFDKAAKYYEQAAVLGIAGAAEALERTRKALHTPEFQETLFRNYQKYRDCDEERALDYLRRSAGLGYEEARRVLGIWDLKEAARLRQEEATDWAEVRTLYEESVDCGSPEGCWELALLKESGKGTAVDQEGADGLIRRAAEKGFGPACTRMGQEEARAGHGEAAFAWYQKGATANDPQACLQAGLCRERGEGCAKDLEKARELLGRARDGGLDEAREPLEQVDLVLGDRFQRESRYGEALDCYEEAAEGDNAEAMLKAAAIRGNQDLEDCYDYGKAMTWYERAASLQPETEETKTARICLKAAGEYPDLLAYLESKHGAQLEGSHYYLGDNIPGDLLENAMKAYGSRLGVDRSEVLLLCDATNALLWGKGKKGFLLTDEGDIFTSQGEKAFVDDFCRVFLNQDRVLQSDTGFVLCTFEESDCSSLDANFASWLSEEVILSKEEYDLAEAHGIFEDEDEEEEETEPSGHPAAAETQPSVQEAPLASGASSVSGTAGFCSHCGAPAKPGARFCTQCGAPLAAAKEAPSDGPSRAALLAFVQQLAPLVNKTNTYLYCAPDIPPKKMANALSSYAQSYGLDPKDILVLCDKTVRGTARDGFLLTWDALISSEKGVFPLKEIGRMEPSTSMWNGKITLQPGNRKFLTIGPDKELTAFCQGMNQLLKG